MKEAAYKSMVRPILEYGSTVWDPHCNGLNDELEKIQRVVGQMEIPGLPNNTTGNLKQKKIISRAPVDQATDESSGPNRLK